MKLDDALEMIIKNQINSLNIVVFDNIFPLGYAFIEFKTQVK